MISFINQMRSFIASFLVQLRLLTSIQAIIFAFLESLPLALVVSWIAISGGSEYAANYLSIGLPLLIILNRSAFGMGWILEEDIRRKTFEFITISRASLTILMSGKAAAVTIFNSISGLICLTYFASILSYDVSKIHFFSGFLSAILALLAIASIGMLFAPLMFLVKIRHGGMNALLPAVIIISGFIYPTSLLPPSIELLSSLTPLAWASKSLLCSVNPIAECSSIWIYWLITIFLSALYIQASQRLFGAVETRLSQPMKTA